MLTKQIIVFSKLIFAFFCFDIYIIKDDVTLSSSIFNDTRRNFIIIYDFMVSNRSSNRILIVLKI